jgi:putative nucleotidyltransferase with HDIG domain
MKSKIGYRAWQFWQSLKSPPKLEEWNKAAAILAPPELELFQELPVPDQNHSLRVLKTLEAGGETDPDLLKAALLHDIGKAVHPLCRWERVFTILLSGFFPGTAAAWGEKDPRGIHRPLVVNHQHPIWGAELAQKAGSSHRVIWLIRHHEADDLTGILDQAGVELLEKLQKADNIN